MLSESYAKFKIAMDVYGIDPEEAAIFGILHCAEEQMGGKPLYESEDGLAKIPRDAMVCIIIAEVAAEIASPKVAWWRELTP